MPACPMSSIPEADPITTSPNFSAAPHALNRAASYFPNAGSGAEPSP